MNDNLNEYSQIGMAMARHFDSVYYVDTETGEYTEFVSMQALEDIDASKKGNDFFGDMESEYMYHADQIWQDYVHPDVIPAYREAVDAVLRGNAEVHQVFYRARRADGNYVLLTTRGFVLSDADGEPEYFGGIIIQQ